MRTYRLPALLALTLLGFAVAFHAASPETPAPAQSPRQGLPATAGEALEGSLRIPADEMLQRRRGTWM